MREESGDVFRAGGTRFNMATILSRANRLHDALAYGEAALANLQIFGDRAAADNIQKVKRLIAAIRQAQQSNKV